MSAVGNRRDRDFVYWQLRPETLEHFLRNNPMQLADGVAIRGSLDRQNGHREPLLVIVRIPTSQPKEPVHAQACVPAVLVEIIEHQSSVEEIDTGRN